jgi:hypothetical protein
MSQNAHEFPNEFQTSGGAEMALRATGEIEGVGGGDYQRMYVPSRLSSDSQYPYEPGEGVRYQVVSTTCDREVLVVLPDTLEIDLEDTELDVRRSTTEVQTSLDEQEVTHDG